MPRSAVERQRDRRKREREGVYLCPVAVSGRSIEAAINVGLLTDADSEDRTKVAAVIRLVFEAAAARDFVTP